MAIVKPFRALRPANPALAEQIASVPYDVVSTEEARSLAEGNPLSFLRVIRSEIELPPTQDPYSEVVYQHAKENLQKLTGDGTLIHDGTPCFYIYSLKTDFHTQTGLVALASLEEYRSGKIKIHEKTRPEKETDRVNHIVTVEAQAEPIFLAYHGTSELDALIAKVQREKSLFEFTAADGVQHTIWRVTDCSEIERGFQKVEALYIADGHHRTASAARASKELSARATSAALSNTDTVLSVIFPDHQLQILPYNRAIRSSSLGESEVLAALKSRAEVVSNGDAQPKQRGDVSFFLGDTWHTLRFRGTPTNSTDPVAALDVSRLQNEILQPLFGVDDPRTAKNIDFIGGGRGTAELERLVRSGAAQIAFSLYPVSIEELFSVADRGESMPPKSTWFEPKPRSGLLINDFHAKS